MVKFKFKFKRNSNLGPINTFSWVILSCKFEELFSYLKSAPSNLLDCKVLCKNKNPQIWEWSLNKLLIYSKPAPSDFSIQCFVPNKKFSCLGLRIPYLCILYFNFEKKNYHHAWNQHLWFCRNAKFHAKVKTAKLGTKNAWVFLSCNFKNYCHIWHQDSWINQMEQFVEGIKKS